MTFTNGWLRCTCHLLELLRFCRQWMQDRSSTNDDQQCERNSPTLVNQRIGVHDNRDRVQVAKQDFDFAGVTTTVMSVGIAITLRVCRLLLTEEVNLGREDNGSGSAAV
jgi:hypothetical protein